MRQTSIALVLFSAAWLGAQTTPSPEIGLDVNADTDAVVSQGWPLLIRAAVISADGTPLTVGLASGAWTQALHLIITDQNGAVQNWPVQLMPSASDALSLSSFTNAEAVWLVAPDATSSIAAGVYNLTATLDTTAGAADGTWVGTVGGNGATVQLQAEPGALSAEDEASKYLTLAAYAQFQGDLQGAGAALDTLISRQPDILMAYTRKADVLAAGGDYADALSLYQQAMNMFLAKNPNPAESLTMFTAAMTDLTGKLVGQQNSASGTIRNVVAGGAAPVLATDSIATAYGSRLADTTTSDDAAVSLGGTTVTITDSSGASSIAPLLYVSPGQVNYAVPASLALGPAKVIVKTRDGSTRRGAVTIVDVQPGLFTLNDAGLISGKISRTSARGKQVNQEVYRVDGSGKRVAAPVDVSRDRVVLEIYATGIRHASSAHVKVTIGGVSVPVTYSGAQGTSVGLDQVNVELPATLAGRGDVPLVLMVVGKQANTGRISIK